MTTLNESIKSIKHLENLDVDEFLDVVTNLNDYIVSEKVDGASLTVGLDDNGLYTSYGKQSHDKKYNQSEYDFRFATIYRRTSHEALEQIEDTLRKHMSVGDEIALEILFGKYPNVVPYSNASNTIVFLQNNRGSTDIDALSRELEGKSVQVKLVVPVTVDGVSIQKVRNTYAFQFSEVPTAAIEGELLNYINQAIAPHIKRLRRFLAQSSGVSDLTVKEVIGFNLRKKPDNVSSAMWPQMKDEIKSKRSDFNDELKNVYYPPIKKVLLQTIVNSNYSRFGAPEDWIEGVVIRHPYRNTIVKIVDKELFLGAKEFLWDIREKLFSLPFSLDDITSFRSKLLRDTGSLFGFPELGLIRATSDLKRRGNSIKEVVLSFNVPDNIDKKLLAVVRQSRTKLENFLNSYLSRYPSLSKEIKGREFTYDGEIHSRTLQVFADMFLELDRLEKIALNTNNKHAIVKKILSQNLNRIFGE